MSNSYVDFSDGFLELAGVTGGKRKRHEGSSKSGAEHREAAPSMNSTSNFDCGEGDVEENPYPLDGKYIDEYDRHLLLRMPELEREDIVARRFEEVQRIRDMRNLDRMLNGDGDSHHLDKAVGGSVTQAAKRQHTVRGANEGKSQKLDELRAKRKAKRKAKNERKQARASPAQSSSIVSESRGSRMHDRSLSTMDLKTLDEEEITKSEKEEKVRKLLGITVDNDEPITIADINKVRLTRDTLTKYFLVPWFDDYVKGAYVRCPVEVDRYRIYEICRVRICSKHYKIKGGITCNLALELKYGTSVAVVLMDKVSDEDFNEDEFSRFKSAWKYTRVNLPTKRDLEKKGAQMSKLMEQSTTHKDVAPKLRKRKKRNRFQGDAGRPQGNRSQLGRGRPAEPRTLVLRNREVRVVDRPQNYGHQTQP